MNEGILAENLKNKCQKIMEKRNNFEENLWPTFFGKDKFAASSWPQQFQQVEAVQREKAQITMEIEKVCHLV